MNTNDSEKNGKTAYLIIWIIAFLLFVVLFANFIIHGKAIKYYNQGNGLFREGDYENAESKYSRTLLEKYTKWMECRIRINYALSITTPITPETVTSENLEESISRLESAIEILTINGCAHDYDSKGHNKNAQTLEEEIEEYIKWLKENVPPEDNDENDEQDDKGGEDDNKDETKSNNRGLSEEDQKKQDELKEVFTDIQQQGLNERMQEMAREQYIGKYEYYSGKSW